MEKLKLPVIRKPVVLEAKTLSMDEYLRFVIFNLKYAANKKNYRNLRRAQAVEAPFRLIGE